MEGGNSVYGDFVLRFISPDTIPALDWSSPKYIPVLKAWGAPEEPYTEKGSPLIPFSADHADIPRFEAPVVLLVDRKHLLSPKILLRFSRVQNGVQLSVLRQVAAPVSP